MGIPQQPAADAAVVMAKICSCPGCRRRQDLDTQHSYAVTVSNELTGNKDRLIFIPHDISPPGYYTIDQLSTIEQALAYYGVDLLPLDVSLLH